MSDEVKKYHEEDAIGKTYDLRVTMRLFRYLKPYWWLAAGALSLTLLTNILISTQPYFTKIAVDNYITPRQVDGIWLFAGAFFCGISITVCFLLCSGGPRQQHRPKGNV